MATIRKHVFSLDESNSVVLYGDSSKLDNFFDGLAVAAEAPLTTSNQSVNGHSRKRYPGDPGFNVSGHSRERKVVPTKGGNTLPGFRFWCERPTGTGANRRSNAVQFSYVGDWGSLVTLAQSAGKGANFVLRNSSGRSKLIVPD